MVTQSNIIAFRRRPVQFTVPAKSQGQSNTPLRMLIIDATPGNRMAVRLALEAQGFMLTEADTGKGGLAAAAAQTPDCILLDHQLPDYDALQLLEALRMPSGQIPCAVVMMTETGDSSAVAELLGAGALDYLVKGHFDDDRLQRAVRGSVEQFRLNAAGQATEERHRHFAAIVEHSTDAIFSVGLDNVVRSWNPGATELFGYSEWEAIGRLIDDLIIPRDLQEERREIYAAVVTERSAVLIETTRRRKDGSSVDVEINSSPLPDAMGRVSGISVIMRDISARKEAERALLELTARNAETNRRFVAAVLNSPITAFEQDLDLRYTWLHNPMPGFEPDQVIGRTEDEVMDPAILKEVKAIKRNAIDSGLLVRAELAVAAAEGPVGYYDLQVEPRRDADGKISGIICISTDITDRKRMEDALRNSEQRFRRIIEHAAMGIAICGVDGRFEIANPAFCKLVGYTQDELKLTTFAALVYPDDREANLAEARLLLERKLPYAEIENRYLHRDGYPVHVQKLISVLFDDTGKPLHFIAVTNDLTERRRVQEQLRASEERLRLAAEAAGFGLYEYDPASRISIWSGEMFKIFGMEPGGEVHISTILAAIHPDDRARYEAFQDVPADEKTDGHYEIQYRICRKGETRWVLEKGQALFAGEKGKRYEVLARGTIVDISARVRAEEHNTLLTREVNHRSKNLLAVVQAVARQTSKNADPRLFVDQFNNRLAGLSASLDLLVKSEWQGTDIGDLVRSQLAHFANLIGRRVTIAGPLVQITAEAAQAIGMALHELSTNAAKYGALSNNSGKVNIAWDVLGGEAGRTFTMAWVESGGPACQEPERRGFGYTVTVLMTSQALDAEVSLIYPPSGLNWHISADAASVLSAATRLRMNTLTLE